MIKLYLDTLRGKKEKTWFTIIRIKREDLDVMDKIFEDTFSKTDTQKIENLNYLYPFLKPKFKLKTSLPTKQTPETQVASLVNDTTCLRKK